MGQVKRVVMMEEAYYARQAKESWTHRQIGQWSIGVNAEDGGTLGEVILAWFDHGGRRPVWHLEAFSDGLPVLVKAGLLDVLNANPDADRPTMLRALTRAGWVDQTPGRA